MRHSWLSRPFGIFARVRIRPPSLILQVPDRKSNSQRYRGRCPRPSDLCSGIDVGQLFGNDAVVSTAHLSPSDDLPPDLISHLSNRLDRLPVNRIRTLADYYALCSIETDHVRRLAREFNLTVEQHAMVESWWRERVRKRLAGVLDSILEEAGSRRHRLTVRYLSNNPSSNTPRLLHKALWQLKFNTLGPGGRTWFGNRYMWIRGYTFRLHWRA